MFIPTSAVFKVTAYKANSPNNLDAHLLICERVKPRHDIVLHGFHSPGILIKTDGKADSIKNAEQSHHLQDMQGVFNRRHHGHRMFAYIL